MPALKAARPLERRALATADAYLRLNTTTGAADAVNGQQVDFALVDLHRDDDVRPGRGGRYQVVTAEGHMVRYAPIAQGRTEYVGWYEHATHPDGRTTRKHAPVTGKQLHKAVVRGDGIHLLADGTIVRLARGRCAETWTPLPDTPSESY
ncbi:hypothetical protein E6R60_26770 [Streptomyces sp. A0642]|uniref:hypothetical protein n=1 Tax=Streptomyces sp. A0642 TaxID=2563100 RepID=UPI0010A20EFC|nr:hypothetical protein [Streptomyces sp. A0642]THA72534.1 hypothetical protein E6R60_26770 [Streptomyces sp. A0642]